MLKRFGSSQTIGPMARAKARQRDLKPRLGAFIAMTIAGMLGGLVFLAGYTLVPQVIRAPSITIPLGSYRKIESRDGGIVETVHIGDGETVEMGTALINLRNPDLVREAQSLMESTASTKARYSNVLLILEALDANNLEQRANLETLRAHGLPQAAARLQVYVESQKIKSSLIAQKRNTIKILEQALEIAKQRATRQQVTLKNTRMLANRGLVTNKNLRTEEQQADSMQTAVSDALVRLAESQEELMIAEAERQNEALTLSEEHLIELAELEAELARLEIANRNVAARRAELKIKSPARGIIQSVSFPSVGEVIEPGETVFELLPTHQSLIVEARIPNVEIGHVKASQAVTVTFDSFDERRYGTVEGVVRSMSPVPLTDEQTGEQYFRAAIELNRDTVGSGVFERRIQAGLTATTEMVTGEETLLAYFLRPMERTLDRAFTER